MSLYEKCPRFDVCSAPKCPLDDYYHERTEEPGDEQCSLPKRWRVKLAEENPEYKTPFGGRTPKEWSFFKRSKSYTQDKSLEIAKSPLQTEASHA